MSCYCHHTFINHTKNWPIGHVENVTYITCLIKIAHITATFKKFTNLVFTNTKGQGLCVLKDESVGTRNVKWIDDDKVNFIRVEEGD